MIVLPGQQSAYILQRTTLETNFHHRAYQQPDHMVEKPISLDMEAYSSSLGTKLPFGTGEPTPVMRLVGFGSKSPEIVLTLELTSRGFEEPQIQRSPERPLEGPTKG